MANTVCQTSEKSLAKQKTILWPQWIGGFGGLLLLNQLGMVAGWTSPYVAKLTEEGSPIPITLTEASWVVSFFNLGRLFGAVVGSASVNYLGSKTTILVTSVPLALCWILTMVANHVFWLYGSRLLGGVSLGMTYSSFSLYLGEIANPKIRGALVALAMTGLTTGNLVMCSMGAYLRMEISGAVSLAFCLILMILFVWLPESPHHLVKKKLDQKARSSILWYHRDCDVEVELQSLKEFVESFASQSFLGTMKEFNSPPIRKALIITSVLFMYSQMCGINYVLFYMEMILRNSHVTVIKPSLVVVIVMVFGIAGSLFSMFLIERLGRRILMASTVFTVTVSLICLGLTFLLMHNGHDPTSFQGLPIFSVIVFQVSVFAGILSVPSAVLGEIFPPHVKCVAACLGSITAGAFAFVSSITYQPMLDTIGEEYTSFAYAIINLTAIPFILFCLPETKGKTLQEIQDELMKKG